MPRLHELTAAYAHIDTILDDEMLTNEQLLVYFEAIDGALKEKGENIAKLIENLESTAENIKAAENRMKARRQSIENRADNIRNYLLTNMLNSQIFKIDCPHFKIAVRNSPPSVVIEDDNLIPAEYLKQPERPPPDKRKILEDLKHGVVIDGVRLEQDRKYLSIT